MPEVQRKAATASEIQTAIQTLQEYAFATAHARGLIDGSSNIAEEIMGAIDELSEAYRYHRRAVNLRDLTVGPEGKPRGFSVALANTILRCLTLAQLTGNDLGAATIMRFTYNQKRAANNAR